MENLLISDLDPLSVAQIHASILSIFIGILSAYAFYIYGKVDEMTTQIFQEADGINDIRSPGSLGLTGEEMYIASDKNSRKKLVERFVRLAMGLSGFEDLPMILAPEERAEEILQIMSAIMSYYPFPTMVKPNPEGGIIIGEPEQIQFNDLEEIRRWVSDVNNVTRQIIWVWEGFHHSILEYIQALSEKQNKSLRAFSDQADIKSYLSPGRLRDMQQMESLTKDVPIRFSEAFFQNIDRARGVSQSVKNRIDQLDNYRKRQPSKLFLIIALVLAGITFASGVIYPLFFPEVPVLFLQLIPTSFHILAFAYILKGFVL